jgi:hypothetical protein
VAIGNCGSSRRLDSSQLVVEAVHSLSTVEFTMIAHIALLWAVSLAGLVSTRPTNQVSFETTQSPRPLVIWYVDLIEPTNETGMV